MEGRKKKSPKSKRSADGASNERRESVARECVV